MNDDGEDVLHESEQWWLATIGNLLVWARLRVRTSGTAEVFDCDGRTEVYDSEETARAALMDAEFRAFDGIDEDDALQMGFELDEMEPPRIADDAEEEEMRAAMSRRLPSQH